MNCTLKGSYVEFLIPQVMGFGYGALGNQFDSDEVMKVEPP